MILDGASPDGQWLILGLAATAAGLVSLLSIALMLRFDRVVPLDRPNHRSLHQVPVPRSGGIGILAGTMVCLIAAKPPGVLWISLAAVAGISLLDDFRQVPARIRFAVQFLSAIAAIWLLAPAGWGMVAQTAAVLCIVWMANLFNFMDGANGLAGGMAVFGFGAYAAAASLSGQTDLAIWSAGIAAAAGGFLVFNTDPAKIFMGDVGSVPLGFLAALFGLYGFWRGAWPIWFPPLVFSVFVLDSTVTLLRRGARREIFWLPHREHYYQRLIRSGWSHGRLATTAYLLMFATAGSACLALSATPEVQAWLIAGWCVAYFLLMRRVDRYTAHA